MTIYGYKNFNNYYNRIVKGQNIDNINDFVAAYGNYDYIQTSTVDNFNEADGVQTQHILGRQDNPYFGDCSYILVCKDNINIDSKWFILDQDFKCYGQYQLSLYRDVITENWNQIIEAEAFIERGIVSDDSPFIYNKENITTNQIKKQEVLLKDPTDCAWIVGYIAKNYAEDSSQSMSFRADVFEDATCTYITEIPDVIDPINQPTSNTTYYKPKSLDTGFTFDIELYKLISGKDGRYLKYFITLNKNLGKWNVSKTESTYSVPLGAAVLTGTATYQTAIDILNNDISYATVRSYTTYDNEPEYDTVKAANGKVVKITDPTVEYYKISDTITEEPFNFANTNATLLSDINDALSQIKLGNVQRVLTTVNYTCIKYEIVKVNEGLYSVVMPKAADRVRCRECFDMFCIPYGDITLKNNNATIAELNKDLSLNIAQNISSKLTSVNLYDIQLLPYCPITGITYGNGYIDLNTTETNRYTEIKNASNQTVCALIWCASNKGEIYINKSYDISNKKMQNQTEILRLSSPNYASQFEFNPAKNDGILTFNVDYTYLPISPYIHVAPTFNEGSLYGNEYNDARGLICNGDFSIGYASDKWLEYEYQNKNYNNIFKREIESMDYQHKWDMGTGIAGAVLGAIGTGVQSGSLVGGPAGIAAGIGTGALSAIGGAVNLIGQEKIYQESKDAKIDIWEMQLGNIQALPNSLTKVNAININNKIWPFIEVYDCTDEEKLAVANYIRNNSMNLGINSKIINYVNNSWSYEYIQDRGFIKANIIKIDGIADDTHMLNAINRELYKGVYTKW